MRKIISFVVTLSLIIVLGSQVVSATTPFTTDGGMGGGTLGRFGISNRTATSATFWSEHRVSRHRPEAIINGQRFITVFPQEDSYLNCVKGKSPAIGGR